MLWAQEANSSKVHRTVILHTELRLLSRTINTSEGKKKSVTTKETCDSQFILLFQMNQICTFTPLWAETPIEGDTKLARGKVHKKNMAPWEVAWRSVVLLFSGDIIKVQ